MNTHGDASRQGRAPEYVAWLNMRRRCNEPNHISYNNYGGRGIKVCGRWNEYKNFIEDLGRRPSSLHSLDRIDVNQGYAPENCRWATRKEQNDNRSIRRIENFTTEQLMCELVRRGEFIW